MWNGPMAKMMHSSFEKASYSYGRWRMVSPIYRYTSRVDHRFGLSVPLQHHHSGLLIARRETYTNLLHVKCLKGMVDWATLTDL
jgi:hypothetical protein